MSKDIQKFNEGAKVLQNVDVTTIITGLALGIADAQEKLDNNSIKQISKLAETEIAGKSLLELGFVPAFYAFEFADISASISLKMAFSETLSFDLSIAAAYEKNTNFDKGFFKNLQKHKEKSLSKHASKRSIKSIKASRSIDVEVDGNITKVHEEKGAFNMMEKAKAELTNETKEIRCEAFAEDTTTFENQSDVAIYQSNGMIIISIPLNEFTGTEQALLKIENDYSTATNIVINSSTSPLNFLKTTNFNNTLDNAISKSPGAIGFSNDNIFTSGTVFKKMSFYFKFNGSQLDEAYTFTNKPDSLSKKELKIIAYLLKNCPGLTISIDGHTDGSGDDEYNYKLSERRITSIKDFIVQESKDKDISDQIISNPKGEEGTTTASPTALDRKIVINFPDGFDYIYFLVNIDNPTDVTENTFYSITPTTAYTDPVSFLYGGKTINLNLTSIVDNATTNNYTEQHGFYIEKHADGLFYLLNKEVKVNYFLYNLKEVDFDVKINGKKDKEINKDNASYYSEDIEQSKDKLKEVTKDFDGDKTFAMSGSLDARYARQFSMSMEGNASVSARLISLPMPTGLEMYLEKLYGVDINPVKPE